MKSSHIAALIAGFFLPIFNCAAQPAFLTNGLVAYFPFNGNANDYSGNGNNGTIQGATFTTNRFGITNSALYFDGTDRVVVPDSPSLDPTNAITIAAWINAISWNGNPRIACKGDSEYDFNDEFGSLEFSLNIGASTNGVADTTLPSANAWHHCVGTYDGIFVKIYVDGQVVSSQTATGAISSAGTPLLNIGAKPDSTNPVDFFTGSIDDVRIYNRALSSNEVSLLFSIESVLPPLPTITTQPQSTSNKIGDTVNFSVGTSNCAPLTFQWFFDNNPLSGATNGTLTITNVQQENVGGYFIVVSDFTGSVTSTVASLNIAGVPGWINNGLVVYYPLHGDFNDRSINSNNLEAIS